MVQKHGHPHRFWLESWSGSIIVVFVVLWVLEGLYSGHNILATTAQLDERFGMKESIGHLLGQSRV